MINKNHEIPDSLSLKLFIIWLLWCSNIININICFMTIEKSFLLKNGIYLIIYAVINMKAEFRLCTKLLIDLNKNEVFIHNLMI